MARTTFGLAKRRIKRIVVIAGVGLTLGVSVVPADLANAKGHGGGGGTTGRKVH